jgi:hypothetical protein
MHFYPPNAHVPDQLKSSRLVLEPLDAAHVQLDYEAVMEDPAMLRAWSQSDWPTDDFTIGENLLDLERHAREHNQRSAFTYTVLSPARDRCLGCVYITPPGARIAGVEGPVVLEPDRSPPTADVCFWVRSSLHSLEVDRTLLRLLYAWMEQDWAFERLIFHASRADLRQMQLFEREGFVDVDFFRHEGPHSRMWAYFERYREA